MARVGRSTVQYWSRVLRTPEDSGQRIVFCEALPDIVDCLHLLATHLFDANVGRVFFNDETRMHKDLLAVATTQILDKWFGKSNATLIAQ